MGQLQIFAAGYASYPQAIARLQKAEQFALAAIRDWVGAVRQNRDPLPRLGGPMAEAGIPEAAYSVHHLMQVIARTARWQVDIRCACCPYLSRDEQRLLCVAALAQAGQLAHARAMLQSSLLSRLGVEFAMGPLEGLGILLNRAGLSLPQRVAGQVVDPLERILGGGFSAIGQDIRIAARDSGAG